PEAAVVLVIFPTDLSAMELRPGSHPILDRSDRAQRQRRTVQEGKTGPGDLVLASDRQLIVQLQKPIADERDVAALIEGGSRVQFEPQEGGARLGGSAPRQPSGIGKGETIRGQ